MKCILFAHASTQNNIPTRVPPWLSEFVCAFHPATPGSSPKHTIYTLKHLKLNLCIVKGTKINKKRPGLAHLKNTLTNPHDNTYIIR